MQFPFIRCPENLGGCVVTARHDWTRHGWIYEHYKIEDDVIDINPEGVMFYADKDLISCANVDDEWLHRRNELWLRFQADHRNWTRPFSIDDFDEETERKRLRAV